MSAAAESFVYPPDSGIANVNTDYGAKGDGVTDDTAAIRAAVAGNRMRPIYFPDGVYLLSGSVGLFDAKPHSDTRFLQLWGQSENGTVLKLKDASPGFSDPAAPKTFVSTYEGKSTGDAMFTNARDLTIDTGSGNPGAIGFRYMTNNFGTMERVTIRSGDGAGAVGLDLSQSQNGPGLIKHVTVQGFDCGILSKNSFSLVLEHIRLVGQRQVGYDNEISRTTIRGLRVEGAPVALRVGPNAQLFLFDAEMKVGASEACAIKIENTPYVLLRNIRQSGYAGIVEGPDSARIEGDTLSEWTPCPRYRLYGNPETAMTLNLPIEEVPEVPWETDFSKWVAVEYGEKGDVTETFQRALDHAAKIGATTVYLPKVRDRGKGEFRISAPLRMHGSVNRILGMNNLLKVEPSPAFLDDTALFTFEDLTSDVIVIERFFQIGGWDRPNILAFDNQSSTTVVVRNLSLTIPTKRGNPGKRWFFEDVSPGRHRPLEVAEGEIVYARQFNPESPAPPMVSVSGGTFWCLGLKTEGRATHVIGRDGASIEILGGVSYQSWSDQKLDPPMFDFVDCRTSVSIGFYHHKEPFSTVVTETEKGEQRQLERAQVKPWFLPVFRTAR